MRGETPHVEINDGAAEKIKKDLEAEELPEHAMQPLDEEEPYFGALEELDPAELLITKMEKLEGKVKPAVDKWRKEVLEATKNLPDLMLIPVDPRDVFSESIENPRTEAERQVFEQLKNSSLRREAANLLDQLEEVTAELKQDTQKRKKAA